MSIQRFALIVASALATLVPAYTQMPPNAPAADTGETRRSASPDAEASNTDTSVQAVPRSDGPTTDSGAPESSEGGRSVWRGYVGVESRLFTQSPAGSTQVRDGVSFVAQPEFSFESADRRHRINVNLFARSSVEPGYSYGDIRELNYQYRRDGWSILAGVNRVFWGVTESRHVVDILNQSDMRENFAGDVKLGQTMIVATLQRAWGQVELYVLPAFRMRAFPPVGDRPRLELPIVGGEVSRNAPVDWAARYSVSRGGVDFHTYYFRGVNREPEFTPVFGAPGQVTALKPWYKEIGQIGTDIQVAHGAWLFKGELMHRMTEYTNYQAGVGGFEYGISRVFGSVSDLALLSEYQFDNRPLTEWPAPATRGVYSGFRLGVNDKASTDIRAGVIYDIPSHSWLVKAEVSRRLANQWGVTIGYYGFSHVMASPALRDFNRDSHVTVSLRRYL